MDAMQLGIEQPAFSRRDDERRLGRISLHLISAIVLADLRIVAQQPGLQAFAERNAGSRRDDLIIEPYVALVLVAGAADDVGTTARKDFLNGHCVLRERACFV